MHPASTASPRDLSDALTAPAAAVERFMARYIDEAELPANLADAIRYALLAGGKRLRPILAAHSCTAVGGTLEDCLPAAAAVEMIHAFSLVHDDLPALDNDALRRGKPTVHVAFGEAMAILAGDGLMSLAFQVLADRCPDSALTGQLAAELAVGTTNMIAGQVYDTLGGFEPSLDPAARLEQVHRNKTGALIRGACRMGAISGQHRGRPDANALAAVTRYGEAIGFMFQIVDDLVDEEQTAEHAGKRTAKDRDAGKLTHPGIHGAERSKAAVVRLRGEALEALAPLGPAASPLAELCEYLAVRTR
jgi:geranylgeranyl diphosphate synthase type II